MGCAYGGRDLTKENSPRIRLPPSLYRLLGLTHLDPHLLLRTRSFEFSVYIFPLLCFASGQMKEGIFKDETENDRRGKACSQSYLACHRIPVLFGRATCSTRDFTHITTLVYYSTIITSHLVESRLNSSTEEPHNRAFQRLSYRQYILYSIKRHIVMGRCRSLPLSLDFWYLNTVLF